MKELTYTWVNGKLYVVLNGETIDTGVYELSLRNLCNQNNKDYEKVVTDVISALNTRYLIMSRNQAGSMSHNDLMFHVLSRYTSGNTKRGVKAAPADFGLSVDYGSVIDHMSGEELNDLCCVVRTSLKDTCGEYFRSDMWTSMFYTIYRYHELSLALIKAAAEMW